MNKSAPLIAPRIRAVRRYLRMTGEQFAESLGTTKQKISLVENGKRAPSAEMLSSIAHTHNIDARYLLGQIDEIMPHDESVQLPHGDEDAPHAEAQVAQVLPKISNELREIREAVAKIPGESGAQCLDPEKQSLLIQLVSIALTSDAAELNELLRQKHSWKAERS